MIYKISIGFPNSEDLILNLPEDIIRKSFQKSSMKAPERCAFLRSLFYGYIIRSVQDLLTRGTYVKTTMILSFLIDGLGSF